MRPSQLLEIHRAAIREIASAHKAGRVYVFGSVAHANDTEQSDLDLLVEPLPGITLFDLGAIQIEIEERLGIPVDVLTPGDLPSSFREQAMREAVPV